MSALDSLRPQFQAIVFGASGGIGNAMVNVLADDPRCGRLFIGSRKRLPARPKCTPFIFDLISEESIADASSKFPPSGEIDLIVVATGVLHSPLLTPEKTFRSLDALMMQQSHAINAIGPALIAKHTLSLLPRTHKSIFAALSARVGSISDNRLGGWHAYRASKAALNQLIRTCAIELAMRNKHAICVTLHPGTVDTALSKPFQSAVAAQKLSSPNMAAKNLLSVMNSLTPAQSGGFFAWDGTPVMF